MNASKARHIIFLICYSLILLSVKTFAQPESNNWYFGNQAGLNFSSGTAVAVTDGKMSNQEGVTSISNIRGELLFYTDGQNVFNKAHGIMSNGTGLLGDPSSSQSAIIVQQPIRGNRYFVFTVDDEGGSNGFRYSIVDTNLNSGYGGVLSSDKNKQVLSPVCEKIAAVKHANTEDVWIVAQHWGSDKFYAYLLTATGLSSTPVVSSIATPVGPSTSKSDIGYTKGYLRFSPDGKYLVNPVVGNQTTNSDGYWEIYNFDDRTGSISNRKVFNNSNKPSIVADYDGIYGAEFSANSRFLYLACRRNSTSVNNKIWQFDLKNSNFTDINNSCVQIAQDPGGTGLSNSWGGMQLGLDGKIYIARYDQTNLAVIERPNCKGSNSSFVLNGVGLGGKRSQSGLPSFVVSFFSKPEFEFGDSINNSSGVCFGNKTQFWLGDTAGVDSVHWIFGDPMSGSKNFSKLFFPDHVFTKDSSFNVQAVIFRKGVNPLCLLDTVIRVVNIFGLPKFDLGRDTSLCQGDTIIINPTPGGMFLWHDNTFGTNFIGSKSDTVIAQISSNGCRFSDTLLLYLLPYPLANLGRDTAVCDGTFLTFKSGKADRYLWNTNSTDSAIVVNQSGAYGSEPLTAIVFL